MCSAAILAGGRARRFGGRDKSALPVGDDRIIDRQLGVLREVADEVALVAPDAARFQHLGLPVWIDCWPDAGPLGGIYTAVVRAAAPRVLVVACDMPFLRAPFLRHLIASGPGVDAVMPRTADGYQPLCALYTRECAEPLRRQRAAGVLKVSALLASIRVRELPPEEIAPFDPDDTLFFNVNTPDDYARSLSLLRARSA